MKDALSGGLDSLSGIDMDPMQMAGKLQDPDGIANMLTEAGPAGDSPAEILADIVNVHRADTRMLGRKLGVDVEADTMTPERAAQLLAGTVAGDGVDLVVMFNEMAAKRDKVLAEVLDDDEYERFMQAKHRAMNTTDPGDFDGDDVDPEGDE